MQRWRAKHYTVRISPSRTLFITIRRFRIAKLRRGKSFKQIVLPVYFSSIKEIAIRQQKRKHKRSRQAKINAYLRPAKIVPVILMVIGLAGMLFFGLQISTRHKLEPAKTFSLPAPSPSDAKSTPPSTAKGMARSEPTHISIPSINIDYDVMSVGREPDGTMQTPPLFEKITGWYKYSPTPGEIGPAVIVGHIDTYKGPSVFWRLREVEPGAIIDVARADGSVAKFKVDALKQFDQDKFPTQEVYGNIDHAGLRVITCGGTFNRETGHYSQNTVVFASAVL